MSITGSPEMAADEAGTLACLRHLLAEVIEPKVAQFN
jgi:hypothetical protein